MTRIADQPARRPSPTRQVAALTDQVTQLAQKVAALETQAAEASADPATGEAAAERYFPKLEEFVNLWLLPTFRRPLAALGMGSWHWCPRWWGHPEARMVFGALWDQWEANRDEPLGMVEFTRDVLQLLPQVCGAHGPFARCRADADDGRGETRRHQHLPVVPAAPAPPGWWDGWWGSDDDQKPDPEQPALMFPGVEEFVLNLLLPMFRRDPNAVGMMRWNWCDQWWRHEEVVHCYLNLWYLFEARAPQRRLIEFVREVYFLLPHLHGDTGPMRECTPSGKPGGPRHTDVTIAPVEERPEAATPGSSETDWIGDLAASLQRRHHPLTAATTPIPAASADGTRPLEDRRNWRVSTTEPQPLRL